MTKKVVLITGASSGIGLATANKLHDAGYIVYGTSRREINAETKFSFNMIQLNVDHDDSVTAAIQKVIEKESRIDVLINNAGFAISPAGAEESSIAQAQALFNTNFFGVVRMTHAVIPHMRQQGIGQIVNISSVLGLIPMPYGALYSASKHALEGYSESLNHELRTQGIRVTLIEPAYTKTSLDVNLLEADQKIAHYDQIRTKMHQNMIQSIQHSDDPDVVAQTILKIIQHNNPQPRYSAGSTAKNLKNLRRFTPAPLFDKLIQRTIKI